MSIAEKLTTIAENQQKVYDAGQQAEYDRFWDAYQENGQRENYEYTFYRWSAELFKPKYIIKPTKASLLLCECKATDRQYLDKIDLSQATVVKAPFASTVMPSFGVVDLSSVKANSTVTDLFRDNAVIHTIDKIVVHDTIRSSQWFNGCSSLANVTFEGVINTDVNLQWSPLTVESMKNIILHLQDMYLVDDGDAIWTNGVYFSEECWSALDADSPAPHGGTWSDYVLNWLAWLT